MKFIPEDVIWAEFWKKYYKRPESWRIYSGITKNRYPEVLISGEKESWMIRRESLYSGKMGIGGKLEENIAINPYSNPYGFRGIPVRDINKILSIKEDDVNQIERSNIIRELLEKPPTTIERIKSPLAIQGPMLQSSQALPLISKDQKILDKELNIEMKKWKLRRSYLQ